MELEAKIKGGKGKSCTWSEVRILRQLNPTAEICPDTDHPYGCG